jgi:hypothetical protein
MPARLGRAAIQIFQSRGAMSAAAFFMAQAGWLLDLLEGTPGDGGADHMTRPD